MLPTILAQRFDTSCLAVPVEFEPEQIKHIRELNTSESTVQKWETGAKRPSGMALKLLSVIQKHGLDVLA